MNVLILEDEIPAYNKLLLYLTEISNDGISHTHIRSVAEGIRFLSINKSFDLILADIKLLDGSSFEIFTKGDLNIPIIFCTAHDEHLLDAFNANGIAYVLKPYSIREIENAISKFKKLFLNKPINKVVLDDFKNIIDRGNQSFKKRFAIKKNSGIFLLQTKNISHIDAFGDFCKIVDHEGKTHLISQGIGSLISELDPDIFFRVNRSQIINIEYIEKIINYSKNRFCISMNNTAKKIISSSSNSREFRKWLNL